MQKLNFNANSVRPPFSYQENWGMIERFWMGMKYTDFNAKCYYCDSDKACEGLTLQKYTEQIQAYHVAT